MTKKGVYIVGYTTVILTDITVISAATVSSNNNINYLYLIADSLSVSQSRLLSVVINAILSSAITSTIQNADIVSLLCDDFVICS